MADLQILKITPNPIQSGESVTVTYSVNPPETTIAWQAANGYGQTNVIATGNSTTGSFVFNGECYGRGGNDINITISALGQTASQNAGTNCPD